MGSDLYRFWVRYGEAYSAWYYTNGRADVVASVPDPLTGTPADKTFVRCPIKRKDGNRTLLDFEVTVSLPADRAPITQFAVWNPAAVLVMDIFDATLALRYSGRVGKVKFREKNRWAEVEARALGEFLKSDLPREVYSPRCRFDLFDSRCGLDRADYKLTLAVSGTGYTVGGVEITKAPEIGAQGEHYYSGGYVECGGLRVFIRYQTGNTLRLMNPFVILPGSNFDIYPGCSKVVDVCEEKFSNDGRFGGFADVPGRNPVVHGF